MNRHLLVKMHQLSVPDLGNSLAKAGPMSEANALAAVIGALIYCIFPAQLNESELSRGSLGNFRKQE